MRLVGVKLMMLLLMFFMVQCTQGPQYARKVMDIPSAAKETSGLAINGSSFITHNDSGDGPNIYVLDTVQGNISRKVELRGAKNVDWEDMEASDGWLYIADTGDNTSNRFKNSVYKIHLDTLTTSGKLTRKFEEIEFTFINKKEKRKKVNSEAMMVVRDTIYFFSKDSKETDIFMLAPGSVEAEKIGDVKLPFAVTAACWMGNGTFAVSGYEKVTDTFYLSDVAIIKVDRLSEWKGEEWRVMNLKLRAQVEGIAHDGNRLFISAEGIGISPGRLMELNVNLD